LGQRIDAVREQPARLVALLAGTGEADVRVGSEGNGFALVAEAVVEPAVSGRRGTARDLIDGRRSANYAFGKSDF
jgi:hypothetical protein